MSFNDSKQRIKFFETSILCTIFFTLILSMNYPSFTSITGGLFTPSNSTTWLGFASLMFASVATIALRRRIKFSIIHVGYVACLVLFLLPLLYSNTSFFKYEYMTILGILAAVSLIFVIAQHSGNKFKRSVLLLLYLSSLIQTFWGLTQYYFISDSNILFVLADQGRPVGVFNQINIFSTYLSIGSLLAIYFLYTAKKQTVLLMAITFVVLIINAHLNVLADTKTGRVVSLIAIGMYLAHYAFNRRSYMLPICLLLCSIIFSFTPKHWFYDQLGETIAAPIGIQSIGVRPIIYSLSLDLIAQKPLTGYGIGSVRKEFAFKNGEYRQTHPNYLDSGQVAHVHNEILQWMIQHGLLSLFSFLTLFAVWVWGLKKKHLDPTILLLGLPFVGHSLLEFPFYDSAPHLLAFALILGMAIKRPCYKVNITQKMASSTLLVACIVCFQIVNFMFASLASSKAHTQYHQGGSQDITILEAVTPTSTFALLYEIEKFEWKLDNGFKTGQIDKDDIFSFINWAEEIKDYWPVNKVYIRLAQSYIISQNYDAANKILDEALFIFPDDPQVNDMVSKMKQFIK